MRVRTYKALASSTSSDASRSLPSHHSNLAVKTNALSYKLALGQSPEGSLIPTKPPPGDHQQHIICRIAENLVPNTRRFHAQ
jgi:hypothetical protein